MSSPDRRHHKAEPTELEGRRVELHPATDRWMQGDRFGTILGRVHGRPGVYFVHLDRSNTTAQLHIDNLNLLPERSPDDPAAGT